MVILKDEAQAQNNIAAMRLIYNLFIPAILFCFISSLSGCVFTKKLPDKESRPSLVLLEPEDYPVFSDDLFYDGLVNSINQSLGYFAKMLPDKLFSFGEDVRTTDEMVRSLEIFREFLLNNPSSSSLNKFIRENYLVYKSTGKPESGEVLFTGYYEPSLKGSTERKGPYQFPVFAMPEDLVTINLRNFSDRESFRRTLIGRCTGENSVVPYYTRKEIGNGDLLMGKAPVIAWVDDAIDLFFLEIQGSGIIFLDNGSTIRVHYHQKNGHSYKSIGSYLIRNNSIPREEMSMQRIREYLDNHPDEVREILDYNTSYVFFKLEDGGPYGCYNAEVTPGRSIATDKRIFPACGLAFIETRKPVIDGDAAIDEWIDFGRFVLNQDTGGAIRGPGRADIFKGNGEYAEIAAGHMQHTGTMYFLALKK